GATPATKPTYPKKLPTVLIAAFAAFALSAGFTVTGALLAPPAAMAAAKFEVPEPVSSIVTVIEPTTTTTPAVPRVVPQPSPPPASPAPAAVSRPAFNTAASIEQVAHVFSQSGEAGRRI